MLESPQARPSFAPRNWAGWIGVSLIWVLGLLPRRLGLLLVAPLGPLLYYLGGSRRKIAHRNLERCFPEKSAAEREQIQREVFASLGRMVAEMAWCWSSLDGRIERIGRIHGLEHLLEARDRGKGVLLLASHNTCLEMGGRIVSMKVGAKGVYRPLKSEVFEWYQNRGRYRYADGMIRKRDTRGMIRHLKHGGVLWYAPDQDFGPAHSEFVPFFGIPTATLLATHRLPRLSGCAVVPMFPHYDPKRKIYDVHILPALEKFPSEDPLADLARVNAILEEQARKVPGQYWWIHRRFKTRPAGEPPFYD